MSMKKTFDLPLRCPISEEDIVVTEIESTESGVVTRGNFHVPKVARLDADQRDFLEVFLRSRGVITTVEKELGISYPTVRARLDALLKSLELEPIQSERKKDRAKSNDAKRKVLEQLEKGEITAQEAKERLRQEDKV